MDNFAGFNLDQQFKLLSGLGYAGPKQQDDIDKFLSANPAAAMQMGKYAITAQKRMEKLRGPRQMAEGGIVTPGEGAGQDAAQAGIDFNLRLDANPQQVYENQQNRVNENQAVITSLTKELTKYEPDSPEYKDIQGRIDFRNKDIGDAQQKMTLAQQKLSQVSNAADRELLSNAVTSPEELVNKATTTPVAQDPSQLIAQGTGEIDNASTYNATQATATTAKAPTTFDAATMDASKVAGKIGNEVDSLTAAQGDVSLRMKAAQGDPEALAQLQLQAAQADAAQVAAVNPRELQPGEAIEGSAVDMNAVNAATQIEAAQADPSKSATVQGQLENLMKDFEGGQTPPWAAGAMRQATAALAARGLGASSMAGMAVIQATMEAAIPIASQDAQTYAQFDMANLNNRQQTVMFAAQQRAQFLGQKFDQEFQTKVLNAQKISEIANMNFTAEQQVALENAQLAQSTNLANLNAANAKVLADAAAMSQMDMTNLNNRQQAQVTNAQNFLQMDLANLSNQQQTNLFKSQANINALLSDQAADNAAKQFNAASENQVNQFFADLQAKIRTFNAEQKNSISQFNATSANTAAQFNSMVENERQQFNATNRLVIAQANAKWRQDIGMAEFEAQNDANMQYAKDLNGLTSDQLDQLWQKERDLMAFVFTASENEAERKNNLLLGDKQLAAEESAAKGALTAKLVDKGLDLLFGW